jgi:hypothetical protein
MRRAPRDGEGTPEGAAGSGAREEGGVTVKESTKELQEKLVRTMREWQKIEDASTASCGRVMEATDNPLIRLVMEIIQRDSQIHHQVQEFIARSIADEALSLTPEELGKVWDGIRKHVEIEKKMVGYVEETLGALRGRKLLVQEYLLHYLHDDEKKHDRLLESLDKIKAGMYPYAG